MHQVPGVQPRMAPAGRKDREGPAAAAPAKFCSTHFQKSSPGFGTSSYIDFLSAQVQTAPTQGTPLAPDRKRATVPKHSSPGISELLLASGYCPRLAYGSSPLRTGAAHFPLSMLRDTPDLKRRKNSCDFFFLK